MRNTRVKRQQNTAQIGRFVIISFLIFFATQMLFQECVLDPEESNDRLYEFWTIDGRSIDYYKNNLPEDMDYPTHLLLENYVPGGKLYGQIKMMRQGWLQSDSIYAAPAIGGIGFYFNEDYNPILDGEGIILHRLVIVPEYIEGDFVYLGSGEVKPFVALKNFKIEEIY